MLVDYARVTTQEQTLAPQHDALAQAGCKRVFTDTICAAALRDQWPTMDRTRARRTDRRPEVHTPPRYARGLEARTALRGFFNRLQPFSRASSE
jgi:hypothetical protein